MVIIILLLLSLFSKTIKTDIPDSLFITMKLKGDMRKMPGLYLGGHIKGIHFRVCNPKDMSKNTIDL